MDKFLLFAYSKGYSYGGMEDCIFITDNFMELNKYAVNYINTNIRYFDCMHYFDCRLGETYEADIRRIDGKKQFMGWNLVESKGGY